MINSLTLSKKRKHDVIYTPKLLAREIINMVPLAENDTVLDPFRGKGAFYDQYPENVTKLWCEISDGLDFFEFNEEVDWIISNPPFSILTKVFEHTVKICKNGFCYIMGVINLTQKRLTIAREYGFELIHIEPFFENEWFRFTCVVVIFQKTSNRMVKLSKIAYKMSDD